MKKFTRLIVAVTLAVLTATCAFGNINPANAAAMANNGLGLTSAQIAQADDVAISANLQVSCGNDSVLNNDTAATISIVSANSNTNNGVPAPVAVNVNSNLANSGINYTAGAAMTLNNAEKTANTTARGAGTAEIVATIHNRTA